MRPTNALALQVKSLRKVYGDVVAVDDLSFEVERGSIFCMIGPNGAGKTTTIECLEGLRKPDAGSVVVAGLDPMADRARFVHTIGVQLQDVGIPPRMKVREALRLFASLYRTSISMSELSDELGLHGSLRKQYGSLSGGQKRRVNIALALVGNPEIAFLDEPTTGLDPEYRFRFWEYLRRQNSRGMTIVATTHYMEEAREYCDEVLLMNEGRVAASGPPERLIAESGLAARVVLPRATLGPLGEDDLATLPGVAHVRTTETSFYVYGDGNLVGDVSDFLSKRGLSPGVVEARPANLDDVYFLAVGNRDLRGGQE
ncbi:MAG: ABC transporter ATP-binding protein [Chloroflexi bacterium]|nr:ABC transporter ATP-binding protein [Chloroflexota bacterium]MCY3937153.1 ABC transporter ATP-binding protein [Chloroflexota bacterium]